MGVEPPTASVRLGRRSLDVASVLLARALGRLPWAVALRVGMSVGAAAGVLARRKTRRVDANLAHAGCPSLRPVRRRAWKLAGATLAEMLWGLARSPESVLRHVEVEGLEALLAAARGGRGVLLVSAHVGNWELVPLVVARAGLAVAVVARRLGTPTLERELHSFRGRGGVRTLVLGRDGTPLCAYRWLSQGRVLGCIMDRAVGDSRLRVPLLGRAANLPLGPLRLACRTGSAVVAGFARRRENGTTLVAFERLREAEGRRDPARAGRVVAEALEVEIRRAPEQWLCIHRRRAPWGDAGDGAMERSPDLAPVGGVGTLGVTARGGEGFGQRRRMRGG
jgi:KDO2-lipid IV(A) lauroyltransferase